MKKFFIKIKDWFKAHGPSKRRLIQVYAALLYNANIKGFVSGSIYQGDSKNLCVPGLNCYSCPGAVGSCPLGALQNSLAASDKQAPFYVIGILALFGLIFARTVCGFLCPVGLGQELLYKIKTPKVKKSKATRILSYFKYVLLFALVIMIPIFFGIGYPAFCKYICPAGTFGGGVGLLSNPNNENLYASLGGLFTWKFALLVVFIVLCIFFYRFFCRFFCPLGAIYGFFNKFAFFGVKLDKEKCTDCGLCVTHCKMDISKVGDHECIQCGECIKVCPTQAITWKGSKIFLHSNAVESSVATQPTEIEESPKLTTLLQSGTTVSEEKTKTANVTVSDTESVTELVYSADKPRKLSASERIKRRNKWLEIAAWSLATVVLIFSLVYYNFIAKDERPAEKSTLYQVGDVLDDFTARTYDGTENGGVFKLSDYEGKVVILNFWATWCGSCVLELPDFNEIQENYADDVVVVAIHSTVFEPSEPDIQAFIDEERSNKTSWSDYSIIFAQDDGSIAVDPDGIERELFMRFPNSGGLPITVILDREGKIALIWDGNLDYTKIYNNIKDLI